MDKVGAGGAAGRKHGASMKERFARLPKPQRDALIADLPLHALEEIARDEWWWTARPEQIPPPGDWLIYLVLSGRGWGKSLPLDTPIPTPTGWSTMGDLKPGDIVFSADGSQTAVSWVSPIQLGNSCYKITFSDGASITADGEHQWAARSRSDRRAGRGYRTVTTLEMINSGTRCSGERQWQMPAASPVVTDEVDLPIDPYVLGVWLGDGSSSGSDFTVGDRDSEEMIGLFEASGVGLRRCDSGVMRYRPPALPVARDSRGRMASNGSLASLLRSLGMIGNKHIPDMYMRAGAGQRAALIEGLVDSDGYVESDTGRIEIATVREGFALQVAELARSIGHRARIISGRATNGGRDVGPKFRIVWVARSGGGRLARKRLPDRSSLGQPNRLTTRYVDSITPAPSVPVRCIAVDHPSHLFLAGREFLVTHNSRAGAEWIVQRTLDHPRDLSGAPTERLVIAETIADARNICISGPSGILRVLDRKGVPYRYVRSPKPQIRFKETGCVIHVEGADDANVGRGYNAADAWLDEVCKWPSPSESWIEGILPSLRSDLPGDHPRTFVTTTPKPIKLIREWASNDDGTVLVVHGSTFHNSMNLSPMVLKQLRKTYEGTLIGQQELEGVLLDAMTGKVFSQADIETARISVDEIPELLRIVVGVDPGATGEDDETGVVVVGHDENYDLYVLEDATIMGVGREAALHCWRKYAQYAGLYGSRTSKLVVEVTLGKRWVSDTYKDAYKELVDEGLFQAGAAQMETVDSKVGKRTRAEPVGMRCQQHRLHFAGPARKFKRLEEQAVEFNPEDPRNSPDRVDALVHACRWLMKKEPRRALVSSPMSSNGRDLDRLRVSLDRYGHGDGGRQVLAGVEATLLN